MVTILILYQWSCGAMDNASDYESEDCRFESCQDRKFFFPSMKVSEDYMNGSAMGW